MNIIKTEMAAILSTASDVIDQTLGEGYSKKNPSLLASVVTAMEAEIRGDRDRGMQINLVEAVSAVACAISNG